jgi:hypothetical protein
LEGASVLRSNYAIPIFPLACDLESKAILRSKLPKIYSQDLLNNLFNHPYTKISFVENELGIKRKTAAKYLEELVKLGLLIRLKIGKENFYLNIDLFNLLKNVPAHKAIAAHDPKMAK